MEHPKTQQFDHREIDIDLCELKRIHILIQGKHVIMSKGLYCISTRKKPLPFVFIR